MTALPTKAVLAALLVAAVPRASNADSSLQAEQIPDKARHLAERGRVLHDAGNYSEAIAAFREAYVLAPSPGLLFNIAQSYRLAGRCDDAAWMYRRYLDTQPSEQRRTLAEAHLAAVEKCGHGGLRVAIVPQVLEMPIPEPHAHAVMPPAETPALSVVAGKPTSSPGLREQRIGLGIAIGGTAALAGAAWFAWEAHADADAVSKAYATGAKGSDISALAERGQRNASTAVAFGVAGGIAVASGVVIYAIGRHSEAAKHVAVAPTRHGAAVHVSWGF